MRTADFITLYAGLWIGGGYLVGSLSRYVTAGWSRDRTLLGVLVEAAVTVAWAGLAYRFIDSVAPGSNDFRNFSAIGFLSPKALTVWESVAIWSGLAAVVGAVAPFPTRGAGGSSGIPGMAGLLIVYSPISFLAALVIFAGAVNITRSARLALLVTFGGVAGTEWILSMVRIRSTWGLVNGPETTLWLVVAAGVLITRWSRGDVPVSSGHQ